MKIMTNKDAMKFLIEETNLEKAADSSWDYIKEGIEAKVNNLNDFTDVISLRNEPAVKFALSEPRTVSNVLTHGIRESAIRRSASLPLMVETAKTVSVILNKPVSYKEIYEDVELHFDDEYNTYGTFKTINSNLIEEARVRLESYIDACKDCFYDKEVYDKAILEKYLPPIIYLTKGM